MQLRFPAPNDWIAEIGMTQSSEPPLLVTTIEWLGLPGSKLVCLAVLSVKHSTSTQSSTFLFLNIWLYLPAILPDALVVPLQFEWRIAPYHGNLSYSPPPSG